MQSGWQRKKDILQIAPIHFNTSQILVGKLSYTSGSRHSLIYRRGRVSVEPKFIGNSFKIALSQVTEMYTKDTLFLSESFCTNVEYHTMYCSSTK